jgi:3-dehydroquinate synthase
VNILPLFVKAGASRYPVHIKRGALSGVGARLAEEAPGARVFVVSDGTVWSLYGNSVSESLEAAGVAFQSVAVPPGEPSKSLERLGALYTELAQGNFTRTDWVLALGGGVVGDLAGTAAATFLRGMPWALAPTTLLSQVDSSVGGKVAVDIPEGKNLVGAFHQPRFVLIDPDVLDSLPDDQFACGMGEAVKHAAIADAAMFRDLEAYGGRAGIRKHLPDVVRRNIVIKRGVVGRDERDMGPRMALNFGHTIGHALEKQAGYGSFTHGEAVAIGMCHITRVSEALGLTLQGTAERLAALCKTYGLPTALPEGAKEALPEAVARDKKNRSGTITLVLLREIGKCFLHTIQLKEIGRFL